MYDWNQRYETIREADERAEKERLARAKARAKAREGEDKEKNVAIRALEKELKETN